ncbi:MAG TPA: hypothetical protein GX697_00350 [Firmicutes bacterium]|nr:hypothetical protein [Bacillota bacterium]
MNAKMKSQYLNSSELMDYIIISLANKRPLSVVSLGVSETFVLAQYNLLSYKEFMKHAEIRVAALGKKRGQQHRGIRFPNVNARDNLVRSLKQADIVGYNTLIKDMHSGLLTEIAFEYYDLWPKYTYESYIRRVIMFSQARKFAEMLKGRKVLLIASYADEVRAALERKWQKQLGFSIAGAVKIYEYEEIPQTINLIRKLDFDLALVAAGVNAIIINVYIAKEMGKVAFDLGQGMESLITGKIQDDNGFLERTIGINRLMKM